MPDIIRIITEKLAAGFLWANAYREDPNKEGRVVTARQLIKTLQTGEGSTGDDLNIVASGVSGYPNDDGPRMFSVEDIY